MQRLAMAPGCVPLAFMISSAGTSIGAIAGALTIARWCVIARVVGVLWVGAVPCLVSNNCGLSPRSAPDAPRVAADRSESLRLNDYGVHYCPTKVSHHEHLQMAEGALP
jgi:hypothetical protein